MESPNSIPFARWCGHRGWLSESVTGTRFAFCFSRPSGLNVIGCSELEVPTRGTESPCFSRLVESDIHRLPPSIQNPHPIDSTTIPVDARPLQCFDQIPRSFRKRFVIQPAKMAGHLGNCELCMRIPTCRRYGRTRPEMPHRNPATECRDQNNRQERVRKWHSIAQWFTASSMFLPEIFTGCENSMFQSKGHGCAKTGSGQAGKMNAAICFIISALQALLCSTSGWHIQKKSLVW